MNFKPTKAIAKISECGNIAKNIGPTEQRTRGFRTYNSDLLPECPDVLMGSCFLSSCFQESGSIYLQFTCATSLQLEVIFEVLEEYDWTAFSVVTTRHHGYEDFLAMVEGMTDGSFIGWEKKSVVILNVTDDPGGARTKRLLKDNEAQVRQWNTNIYFDYSPNSISC